MKKGLALIAVLIVTVGGLAFAMSDAHVRGEFRYRLNITVDTPEGPVTGSAVRAVHDTASGIDILDLPGVAGPAPEVKGEAVVIDLGERGVLFGLIEWNSYEELYAAFPFPGGEKAGDRIRFYRNLETGRQAQLPEKAWPKLVTFADMSDPKSVRAVNPDDLASAFGEAVTLKDITLEITDAPVTWGRVDEFLPWVHDYRGKRLDGNRFGTIKAENRIANSLSAGAFTTRGANDE